MKILIIGDEINFKEAQKKFGSRHTYKHVGAHPESEASLTECDIVFDFLIDKMPHFPAVFSISQPVFLNTCNVSLASLFERKKPAGAFFGFNGLPTLLDRPILEVSLLRKSDSERLAKVCADLDTPFLEVDDRVGMVTPRVIAMIINEAYYTVQEGTATREDIDLAMKLGTNYPFGPFEWCTRIGVENIYALLTAIYEDTRDERYKICPLLKQEFLRR
jgi:3-hydroxybutyryl-CoA dehydrogenase